VAEDVSEGVTYLSFLVDLDAAAALRWSVRPA
jgi:hypothetical protein